MKRKLSHRDHFIIIFAAAFLAIGGVKWTETLYLRELDLNTRNFLDAGFGGPKYAMVEIDFGNGSKRVFKGMVGSYTYTLPEVLDSAARNGKLSFRMRNGGIAEFAGFEGENKWKIYLGGVEKKVPIEKLTVSAGDRFVLRYE